MIFNNNRVYTALNAEELEVGSKVIAANTIANLIKMVNENKDPVTLTEVLSIDFEYRFCIESEVDKLKYQLAYKVSDPEYYIGLNHVGELISTINKSEIEDEIITSFNSKFEANEWVESHKKFEPVMKAYLEGENIQYRYPDGNNWCNVIYSPTWDAKAEYRVMPTPKLKWTDLKVGDVITNENITSLVIGIDSRFSCHVAAMNRTVVEWLSDEELAVWKKVEN